MNIPTRFPEEPNKDEILKSPWAYKVDPNELETIEEFAIWLEAMLSGPCGIWTEKDGTTIVFSQRALVDRIGGMRLIINPNEHPPPHFHVQYDNNNVSFTIESCSLLSGNIGKREEQIIKHWHRHSKEKLIKLWNITRPTDCQVGKL